MAEQPTSDWTLQAGQCAVPTSTSNWTVAAEPCETPASLKTVFKIYIASTGEEYIAATGQAYIGR